MQFGSQEQFANFSFCRLADAYSDDEHTDDEDTLTRTISRTGRVNVVNPRTPGGRVVSRSMDIDREFMFRTDIPSRLQEARALQREDS
jgi:hypothetical protein